MNTQTQNLFDLSGKVAVVTGGNRGIGLGLARGLAEAGANLSLWARDEASTAQAAESLAEAGGEIQTLRCDVSSPEDVEQATAKTLERFGRIDAGFANAGFGDAADPLKLELEDFRRILATNLDGVFLCFKHWGKHMSEREGSGKLVAISSISAIFGTPMQPHYAASKGGVESLVRSYAARLARYDIQVNSVQPGWIVTDATAPAVENAQFSETVVRRIPARRWGEPADLAGVAVYLASDASRYHTGDSLRIDGGYTIF
ncbi:MAG: SDR family oxidoreductase [Myxococcota bacterium]|jgi:NAD(P)-dependent dehydrogenase (short-subunit alcohol dehydrogenase family)|nr:SDR family oxidoreductase [Myxococcota bacterium]